MKSTVPPKAREQLLSTISNLLGESIDYNTTLKNIGKLLVPSFADYVRIVFVNGKKEIEDTAVFHKDTKQAALVKKLYDMYKNQPNTTMGVDYILKTGKSEIMEHVEGEEVKRSSQTVKKTITQLHLTSYMGVPLKLGKKIIGVITFSSITKEKIYTKEDLKLAEGIALRISFAVENARLFKSLQKELEEKENSQSEQERLVSMLDQTFDAIFIWSLRGKITYWNQGAQELYGYSKKDAIGKVSHTLLKTIHPISLSEIEKVLLQTGRWEGELEHTTRSNQHITVSSKMLLVKQHRKKYILETNRDITKQKNNQLGEARLAAIVNSSDDAIISKNLNSVIQTWNQAAEKMFGYTSEEAIGQKIYLIIPKERYNEETKIIRQLKQGKRINHFQTVRQAKNGKKIDISLSLSPVLNETGQVIGASKIARDITEEVRLQNNLQLLSEASKLLSSSLDYKKTLQNLAKLAVPQMADWCAVDMKTETGIEQLAVTHINPEKVKWAKELNKKNPPKLTDKTGVPQVLRTGKSEFVSVITDRMLSETIKDNTQLELLRKLQLSSAMIVPIKLGKKVLGTITFISAESRNHYTKADLTIAEELGARAGIAIENAQLYQQARHSIELRDQFISLASHELKTPITSLKLYAQGLISQINKNNPKNFEAYMQRIDQQVDKLTQLVNDLLNASKIQHGKLDFAMDFIDLNTVIEETVDMVQRTTQNHTILVEGKIEKKVYADSYRIYQVVTNLLSNAIKYSPKADKVLLKLSSGKNVAVVKVQDFGIGIPSRQHKKIFSPFYRAISTDERAFPGLGMGLYISYEIIKRHGGTMKVQSGGKGSEFTFTLPVTSTKQL